MMAFTGDVAADALVEEFNRRRPPGAQISGEIRRRLEYSEGLRSPDQRKRLRQLREALAHRALIRALQRDLEEARALRAERRIPTNEVVP